MLVSVITPTHNRARLLPRAAESVFEQTYDPVEYIIVDDGSTDNTSEVVDQFEYRNVRYCRNETNEGVSAARNRGIEMANGRFVLFLDADDELTPSAISVLVEKLQATPTECIGVFGRQMNYRNDTVTKVSDCTPRSVRYADLNDRNCMGPFGGKLLRTWAFDEIGKVDERLPSSEDFDFFLRAAKRGYHFKCIDNITYKKYNPQDQLTGNTDEWITGQKMVLEKHKSILSTEHHAWRWFRMGRAYARAGSMAEARDCFQTCIRLCPTSHVYWACYLLSFCKFYSSVHSLYHQLFYRWL